MADTDGAPVFEFVDSVPDAGNPVETGDLTCATCGTGLSWSGRGRKPKYCDEHKRRSGVPATSRKGSPAVVERAVDELKMLYAVGGQGLKFVNPIAGEAIVENSDKLAESYRLLLETNTRFRKLFQSMESKAAWLPIIIAHGDVIASILIASKLQKASAATDDAEVPDEVPTAWTA